MAMSGQQGTPETVALLTQPCPQAVGSGLSTYVPGLSVSVSLSPTPVRDG